MGSVTYFRNLNNYYGTNESFWSVNDVLHQLKNVKKISANKWSARCPAHKDERNSLSVGVGLNGKILYKCHAGCSFDDIVASLYFLPFTVKPSNTWKSNTNAIVATYDYCDESGKTLYQVIRYEGKAFRQRRPDGSGGWAWDLKGVRRVLYRLPELLEAEPTINVFIVEGEKDANRLWDSGLVATTNSGGGGKWSDDYNEHLRGRPVVILPDNADIWTHLKK